ncbi:Rab5-interacting family protein [Methylobacillus flagellatus]|uniref:Rab5-interacting family protein n=1 Tax=Methylobacillus flagellatus TaxID=405 RepID=UPI0010F9C958|nr:Rab5-interacting family protein [Methylobacillus flagellatus]
MTTGAIELITEGAANHAMADWGAAVVRGLVDVRFPRVGSFETLRNWEDSDQEGSIVGSPIYSEGYAEFDSGSAYLQTATPSSINLTIISVLKLPVVPTDTTNSGVVAGNLLNGISGFIFYVGLTGGQVALLARRVGSNAGVPVNGSIASLLFSGADPLVERCVCLKMRQVGVNYGVQVRDLTRGVNGTEVLTANPPVLGGNIAIGSSATITGSSHHLCDVIHNVELTDDEINKQYLQLQEYYAALPVPILI